MKMNAIFIIIHISNIRYNVILSLGKALMKQQKIIIPFKNIFFTFIFLAFSYSSIFSQVIKNRSDRKKNKVDSIPAKIIPKQNAGALDTLGFKHRDDLADSITISYRYLDSLRSNRIDSSVNDFSRYFSIPAHYVTLGNNGSAAFPILFSPILKAGWDAGFHAYEAYRFTLEGTKFYKTTRPFSQITYLLASGKEQLINILLTQNIKPNWNFGFEYRLISAPGVFQSQNANHNNYRLFSNYQGRKKRYAAYFVLNGNKLAASENGGIRKDTYLDSTEYTRRFTVPVNLGGDVEKTFNVFSTKITTGNIYKDFTFFFRQSYDLGKRDSVKINDSTAEYLFYPKFRFQHTFTSNSYSYTFKDTLTNKLFARADSAIYKLWYDTAIKTTNGFNFFVQDKWKIISNDFSIRQFPETKNAAQFIEAGIRLENLKGIFFKGVKSFYNVAVHGEYRNKTRDKKWDALAKGEFYVTGLNSGDYNAYATLTRFLNQKFGDVQISFQNINRTPSFIFQELSSFNFKNASLTKKENTIVLSAATENPKFNLTVKNISISNYAYFKNYYRTDQYSSLINISQFIAGKTFHLKLLKKHLNLYSDLIFQKTRPNSPVKVPLFYTRQRVAFEGVFYKNLNLSTGLDINYCTPYKANNYSPVMGQFFPQDTTTIKNLPNVSYFFNFRIKSFTALIKLENLNTLDFKMGGFTNNNFAAPHYPTPGLIFRIGVKWAFVN